MSKLSVSSMTVEQWAKSVIESQTYRNRGSWSYWGPESDNLGVSWGFVFARADANNSLLDDSNFEIFTDRLESEFGNDDPENYHVVGFGGALGHIDKILIRLLDDSGDITPIAHYVYDTLCQLDDYPILDEEHFSNLESESDYRGNIESIQTVISKNWLVSYDDLPKVWDTRENKYQKLEIIVWNWLYEHDSEAIEQASTGYSDKGGYIADTPILAALYSLGVLDLESYDMDELLTLESELLDYAYNDVRTAFYGWNKSTL